MHKIKYILSLSLLFAIVGCQNVVNTLSDNRVVIASIDEKELTLDEVLDIFPDDVSPEDSLLLLNNHAESWLMKELKQGEARTLFSDSQVDIDRMVEEYRTSLMNYKLDQYYVERLIDTVINKEELNEYYNRNSKNLLLDKSMVQGIIIRLPDSYRQHKKIWDMLKSSNLERRQDLLDVCEKNNLPLTLFDEWVSFEEYLTHIPTRREKSYPEIFNSRTVRLLGFNGYKYFFRVFDARDVGDTQPYSCAKQTIRRIILNQRRLDVVRMYEDTLYSNAKKQNRIILNIIKE